MPLLALVALSPAAVCNFCGSDGTGDRRLLILRKTRAFLWRPSVAPTAAVLTAAAAAGSTILLDTFYTPNAYSSSHYIAIISEFEMIGGWCLALLARWFLTFFECFLR
jgi:hypothetical protein